MTEPGPDEKELERRLRDDEVSDDELPEPPPYPKQGVEVVMEDEKPERFNEMMSEMQGKGDATVTQTASSGDVQQDILRAIRELPREIASALGVNE